ncbi:hypothetical protein CDAR_290961 [Caerostris darwini]|uniref:Uncharacterized protein n=1 Tax=Caerostris darwini TaxID=1538125 RepID=A0AAV4VMZ7_9ARAC|nr:hypothetical protein CDAR_290961 [Caerostris darwini]
MAAWQTYTSSTKGLPDSEGNLKVDEDGGQQGGRRLNGSKRIPLTKNNTLETVLFRKRMKTSSNLKMPKEGPVVRSAIKTC